MSINIHARRFLGLPTRHKVAIPIRLGLLTLEDFAALSDEQWYMETFRRAVARGVGEKLCAEIDGVTP